MQLSYSTPSSEDLRRLLVDQTLQWLIPETEERPYRPAEAWQEAPGALQDAGDSKESDETP